jgi:hypothetical protein
LLVRCEGGAGKGCATRVGGDRWAGLAANLVGNDALMTD